MTPWWPWAFPGEAERIIDLARCCPGWISMPADANPFPEFHLFNLNCRRV